MEKKNVVFELQRNHRIWGRKRGSSISKGEEVLDIIVKGIKVGRGLCYAHFRKHFGIRMKIGEKIKYRLVELERRL